MNQALPSLIDPKGFQNPNAALAAEIAQALYQAGLLNADDQKLCENMLNGTAPTDASAWQQLLELPLYTASSAQPDAL
ncbi:hypothetical protein FNT36_10570 [Hymenobacter setariae]|uniref:Uncharacterized protein n=1 Tax=Hymenobacter setariae TaxID=2594794 RepID=A0A558BZA5_9BACT|nr:hypothetical protein [Hymenobacter setariae]TVT41856.1 hypothetical protein FNT36_10570 [Hymenobacter setariae]